MKDYAKELFDALEKLYQDHKDIIGDEELVAKSTIYNTMQEQDVKECYET